MALLLDTHTALWWWADSPRLSRRAHAAIADPSHTVYFSAISAYEIFQKVRLGKLSVPQVLADDVGRAVRDEGWTELPLTTDAAAAAATIEHLHRDPFDRILAAQSVRSDLQLVSSDPFFSSPDLGIDLLW